MSAKKRARKKGIGRPLLIKSRDELRKILAYRKTNSLTFAQTAANFGLGVNTIYNAINRFKKGAAK